MSDLSTLGLSLATGEIDNGALRPFTVSLLGHVVLAGLILFFPGSREKIYIEEIPRAVRLVATLDAPPVPKPAPKPIPAPKPRPKPKARPKVVKPAPVPAVRSKVKIPVKKRPPLVTPRSATPPPTTLQEKLAGRLTTLERKTPAAPPPSAPAVKVPTVAPLPVPATPTPPPAAPRGKLVTVANFPHSWYIAIIKEKIYSRFNPPSSFALGGRRIAAVASFRITREGKPVNISLRESSGHRLFDQSALAALENSSGLPPLPKDYKEDSLDVVIRFQSQNH